MKIELLNQRENFPEIFKTSLEGFLADFAQWRGIYCWGPGGGLEFRQNARLNIIYPVSLPRRLVDELTSEFRYHRSLPRRWAQNAYASLAVRAPFETAATPVMFSLTSPPAGSDAWAFIPGNHSIRVIDFPARRSVVFPKAGFDRELVGRDAAIRQRFPFLLAPRVLDAPSHGRWFIEERIRGLPLNRLAQPMRRKQGLDRALDCLRRLYSATRAQVEMAAYLDDLLVRLDALLVTTGDKMATDLIAAVQRVRQRALAIVKSGGEHSLVIVQSHGDFQPANILVDGSETHIIDWEYSKPRTAFYDFLVYTTNSRFPVGLGDRLVEFLDSAKVAGALPTWFGRQGGDIASWLALFLLEELELKLEENSPAALLDASWNFERWLPEVERALDWLGEQRIGRESRH